MFTGFGFLGNLELLCLDIRDAISIASCDISEKRYEKRWRQNYQKQLASSIDAIKSLKSLGGNDNDVDIQNEIDSILASAIDDDMRKEIMDELDLDHATKKQSKTSEFFDFVSKITEFDEKGASNEMILKNDFFSQLYDICKEDKQEQVIQYLSKLAELISYMKKDIEDDLDEEDIEVMREMIPEWIKAVQAVRECLVM